ncbi:3161_t:CDS:2 [Funneliformis geosporum]|uniref:10593_t:CDS:1 n=1 Tax=Funneliformis geosporum TaxID=1117311 RepID=A0A9W4WWG5_9GLOM|nr:3161_t:CDS:2 [Funneliformis geosporum]CAI2177323.1 10593_t:CDS:2 [Funneliformis geosporum]
MTWKSILKSTISENLKISDTMQPMQLATFNTTMRKPANRSVIFRGFIKDDENSFESDLFCITTDIRSGKVDQLSKNSAFEICWWFSKSREQFRMAGNAYVLSLSFYSKFPFTKLSSYFPPTCNFDWNKELRSQFEKISDELRANLTYPTPGSPLQNENFIKKLGVIGKNDRDNELIQKSFENFALVIFEVEEVDRVELAIDPHKRTNWKLNNQTGEWTEQRVHP